MSSELCAPYKGEQPYLYVSYCKKDCDAVLPILRLLQDEGCRIWYDAGGDPGSQWPGVAPCRLDQSAAFLALISEDWMADSRHLEEFAFAQMRCLPSLAVILKPIQPAPEIKLQIMSVPVVDGGSCAAGELRERLLDRLAPALRQHDGDAGAEGRSPEPAGAEGRTSAGSPPEDPERSPGAPGPRKRLFLIAGAAAVLVLILGIAAVSLNHGGTGDSLSSPGLSAPLPGPGDSPAPSSGPQVDDSAMYHILLIADEDMTPEEFRQSLPILKDRLDLLTGGGSYEMNAGEASVDLYLPKSAFAGLEAAQILKCYISRATELYIFDRTTQQISPGTAQKPIRRDDLASVTLSLGSIPGADAARYGIYAPTYRYLTVQLTDQCAEWFGEEIAAWGDGLAFGQDMETMPDNFYYFYTFPAGDGKTFYILNDDLGDQFLETLAYNMTHPPLPGSLRIAIDLNSQVNWQTAGGESRMGENQCEPGAPEGETVTFTLKEYGSKLTAEALLNTEKELKARLDLLGLPYSFGRTEDESAAVFAVSTGMERMGMPVISLIGGGTVNLRANYWNIRLRGCHFVWETAPDGSCTLALEVDSGTADQLARLTGEGAERDGPLYLTVEDLPVLSGPIKGSVSEGRIVFDRLCFDPGTGITEEYRWLTALAERIMNNPASAPILSLAQLQMTLEDGFTRYDRNRFGISYAGETQTFAQAVHAVAPDALISASQDLGTVYISLNLELGEEMPKRAAALAQAIYEQSGFEQSIFQGMVIYLVEEDDSVLERARILFHKHYASPELDRSPEGYAYVSGIFRGGRLYQYQGAFQRILETDPFYLGLTVADRTSWTW